MEEKNHFSTQYWTISRVAVTTVAVATIVSGFILIITLSRFLMIVFAAVVLAVIFDAIARQFCRLHLIRRPLGIALAVAALFLVFGGAVYLFGSQIAGQFETIRTAVPPAIGELQSFLDRVGLGQIGSNLLTTSDEEVRNLLNQASGFAIAGGGVIANVILIIVGAIFLAADPATYRRGVMKLMPKTASKTFTTALDEATNGLRGWMIGQAVSSLFVAALTWAGLALIGVPAAAGLGLVAGVFDVIPLIGPFIAGAPAVLIAFTQSPQTALWTVALFVLIQQIQGNFLQPMIQKEAVNVPPALLLFAVVGSGTLFGFIGVLLAAPLTVVGFALIRRVYVKQLLGWD